MKIVILGAGGHGRVVAQCVAACAKQDDTHELAGFIDPVLPKGTQIGASTVLGADAAIADLRDQQKATHFIIGLGTIRGGEPKRRMLYESAIANGLSPATIIAPSAIIAPDVVLGKGTVVMPGAVINTGATIGVNAIVNTRASIDHDARIADDVHIAPGCVLSGNVTIGRNTLLGVGSTIMQGVTIGHSVTIGAGTLVIKDIGDGLKAVGAPHRIIASDELR